MTGRPDSRWLGLSALAGMLLYPGIALADNLGGLVYLVIIWPLNALLVILLLALSIVAGLMIKRTGKGKRYPKLGIALMVMPVLACIVSPPLTFILDDAFNARGDIIAFGISIVPTVMVSILCFVLGLILFRRSRRPS